MSYRVVCDQRSLPCDGNNLLLFSHVKIAIWYPGLSTRRFCLSQKGLQTLPAIRKLHSPLSFLYCKNSVTIACVIFMTDAEMTRIQISRALKMRFQQLILARFYCSSIFMQNSWECVASWNHEPLAPIFIQSGI